MSIPLAFIARTGIVNLTHIVDELSPLICYLSGEKGEI